MKHPEKLAALGTIDTGRRQTTLNTKQNTKNNNMAHTLISTKRILITH
jgi:hypothetical protein